MSEKTSAVKMANVTGEEKAIALLKTHDKDKQNFIAVVKKSIKARNIRINTYILKEVSDGMMLKIEIEKFTKGISMGTRWIKGYLTETKSIELEVLLDAIPRKSYTDTRDGVMRERPRKIVKIFEEAKTDIDLATLWDTTEK